MSGARPPEAANPRGGRPRLHRGQGGPIHEDIQSLYAGIAQLLGARLPRPWQRAAVEITVTGGRLAIDLYAIDGARRPLAIAESVVAGLRTTLAADVTRLRELTCAEPADGWHHATFTLFADGRYDCAFFHPQREEVAAV